MARTSTTGYTELGIHLVQRLDIKGHFVGSARFRRFGWSPDGLTFIAQEDNAEEGFLAWHSDTWRNVEPAFGKDAMQDSEHPGRFSTGLAFAPHKSIFAIGGRRGLEIRSLANLARIQQLNSVHLTDLSWSFDGSRLIATSGGDLKVFNSKDWSELPVPNSVRPWSVAWSPEGKDVVFGMRDGAVELWHTDPWREEKRIPPQYGTVITIAWHPSRKVFALGQEAPIVRILNATTLKVDAELERHSASVAGLAYSPDGKVLATASDDGQVCLWDANTYDILAEANVPPKEAGSNMDQSFASVAFHPHMPLIALRNAKDLCIELWEYRMSQGTTVGSNLDYLQYVNAKIVLIGDTGVGKSGLSLALTGQVFQPTESTHGRHVWPFLDEKGETPRGVSQAREALLWDLAGQPGYRLVHQLHLQDTSIALLIFDSRSELDPFGGVRYWDRALRQASRLGTGVPLKRFLIAARIDRGGIGVSRERIDSLVKELGLEGYFETSARDGTGIGELKEELRNSIAWNELPTVSSNQLFQMIKMFLLNVKDEGTLLINLDDLYRRYTKSLNDPKNMGMSKDFEACVARMESRDLIRRLSFGNLLLLQPELLDAYASALVNAAKDEPDGMGHIAEEIALAGRFRLSDDERIRNKEQEQLLLIATVEELLRHEIVLREQTDGGAYLVFPSQFTREHPDLPDPHNKAVIFTFEGAVLNIYSTLVVRLSHTGFFSKREMWKNAAAFRSATGGDCGLTFREVGEGMAELVLFFNAGTSEETRFQFEEYIRTHLERRALPNSLSRRRIFVCSDCGTPISDLQATRRRARGEDSISCNVCDNMVSLLDREERLKATDFKSVDSLDRQADAKRNLEAATAVLRGKVETQDFDVFLAHSSKDKKFVEMIAAKLRAKGINPWLDKEQIPPGRWFQDVIQQAIPKVRSAAIFIGSGGIGPWEAVELRSFISQCVERKLPVIPVLLPGVNDFPRDLIFLRELNGVRFKDLEDAETISYFIWGITGRKLGSTIN